MLGAPPRRAVARQPPWKALRPLSVASRRDPQRDRRGAIDGAQLSSLNNRHSQVTTQEADGTQRVERTFGDDPYPPLT